MWSSGGDLWTDAGRLTDTPVDEAQAVWSPDGMHLAFRVDPPDGPFRIEVTQADGAGRRVVGASGTVNETQPGWSADGRSIVFRRSPVGGKGDVWVMDADGANARPLVQTPGDERYPAFSPDGTRLAYTSDADGDADVVVARRRLGLRVGHRQRRLRLRPVVVARRRAAGLRARARGRQPRQRDLDRGRGWRRRAAADDVGRPGRGPVVVARRDGRRDRGERDPVRRGR